MRAMNVSILIIDGIKKIRGKGEEGSISACIVTILFKSKTFGPEEFEIVFFA